jgi:hypothetical protein
VKADRSCGVFRAPSTARLNPGDAVKKKFTIFSVFMMYPLRCVVAANTVTCAVGESMPQKLVVI